jgi:hypothetical protein
MGFWQFNWHLLALAFAKPWYIAEIIAGVLAIFLGIIIWKRPKWESKMKHLLWGVPLAIFVVLAVIGLVSAPYNAYKEQGIEQEQRRPVLTLGESLGASTSINEDAKMVHVDINLSYRNIRDYPAYQLRFRVGYAPAETPYGFVSKPDLINTNPIYSGIDFYVSLNLSEPFIKIDSTYAVPCKELLVYCDLRYSDAHSGGNWYEDEWWFLYPLNAGALGSALPEQKEALEPYVRLAYGNETQK